MMMSMQYPAPLCLERQDEHIVGIYTSGLLQCNVNILLGLIAHLHISVAIFAIITCNSIILILDQTECISKRCTIECGLVVNLDVSLTVRPGIGAIRALTMGLEAAQLLDLSYSPLVCLEMADTQAHQST
jgi:hypothetical protein